MIDHNERKCRWEYRCVNADNEPYGPLKNVLFPRPVELIDAAQFAAETEHDGLFLRERMHNIEERVAEVDGVGQVFEFVTAHGLKRLRVVCRVKFTYDEVSES